MVRMANVYQAEKNYENAFILHIKFSTLFLEKILSHPEYKPFDPVTKRQNKEKIKEIFPIAEKLKAKILERYQHEYETFLEAEKQRQLEFERDAAAQRKKQKEREKVLAKN